MRVLLADDHSIVRRGLRSLIESQPDITVVAEASDGLEALKLCEEHQPDAIILDVAMPKMNGIEVAERVQKLTRSPSVLILSMHADESYIIRALAAGARAYLLKDATDEDLIPALRGLRVPNYPRLFPILPFAITNPIWVDVDGGGWSAPLPPPSWCRQGDEGC